MKTYPGTISVSEFARRVGVTEGAIRKAIAAGKISSAAIQKIPTGNRIIESVALSDWQKNYAPEYVQSKALEEKLMNPLPEIPEGMEHIDDGPQEPGDTIRVPKNATMAEAKRVEAIYRAKIAGLDLRERNNQLIDKVKADKEYYAAGQIVRQAIQAIPDKHIDNILACSTRMEAHQILTAAIIEALESIPKMVEV